MLHNTVLIERLNIKSILIIAFSLRLIALIFAQGYSHHDDHFLVIEVAEAWVHNIDIANWFTDNYEGITSGRSLLYPGLHYIIFKALDFIGLENLKTKVLIFRFIQVTYSLLIVYYSYAITKLLSNETKAKVVALVCAILWLFPNISVRSLTEVVAIPPLLLGSFFILKGIKEDKNILLYLLGGFCFGIAFSLRYQVSVYIIGFLLGTLIWKEWRAFFTSSLTGFIYFLIVHGYGDYLASGVYFGKVIFYIEYNLKFASEFVQMPWYNHILVVIGFLVPPIGLILFLGTLKTKKEYLPLFLGTIIFLIVHSALKGKQERFMYTMLPFFVILGYLGWCELRKAFKWKKLDKIEKGGWYFALIINSIALIFISTWFGKQSRVDVMNSFKNENVTSYIVANHQLDKVNMLPQAYSGQWKPVYEYTNNLKVDEFVKNIELQSNYVKPNFLILEVPPRKFDFELLEEWKKQFPNISLKENVEGSLMDKLHYNANPVVRNFDYIIYHLND